MQRMVIVVLEWSYSAAEAKPLGRGKIPGSELVRDPAATLKYLRRHCEVLKAAIHRPLNIGAAKEICLTAGRHRGLRRLQI